MKHICETDWKKEFAFRLKQRRKELDMTQEDLAAKAGITQEQISTLENKKSAPLAITVVMLADALSVAPSYLIDF